MLKEGEVFDDNDKFCSFITNEIALDDHHGLFSVIAREIGLGEEIVRMRVIGGEFSRVKEFVFGGLNG